MIKRKVILGTVSLLMGISLLSIAANAQTKGYSLQMPAKGYRDTKVSARKSDTEDRAYNTVDYLGWNQDNDGFIWWIINPDDGKKLTDSMNFNHTGRFQTPYKGDNANDYHGWDLKMRMKTDWFTNHECDVNGKFTP
ncbi:hypothetical protein UT300005_13060 [Clostridium sp. CTA-5]